MAGEGPAVSVGRMPAAPSLLDWRSRLRPLYCLSALPSSGSARASAVKLLNGRGRLRPAVPTEGCFSLAVEQAQTVDRPGRHNVKSAPLRILEHAIEPWAVFAALGAANAGILVHFDDRPAAPFGNLVQLPELVYAGF